VAALTSARDSAQRTTVWIVFRAPDCGLSAELIDALNRVDRTERVQVVGVMLLPPSDTIQQVTLATALGIEFAIVHDVDGVWRRALQRDRQRDPVLYVREGTTLLGGVSPSFLKSFAALDLDEVPMERER
jgi:hypothetical protein